MHFRNDVFKVLLIVSMTSLLPALVDNTSLSSTESMGSLKQEPQWHVNFTPPNMTAHMDTVVTIMVEISSKLI